MQLFYSPTSPYARKARVVLREKGLEHRITEVPCDPWSDPVDLRRANPLGKIPVIVRDDDSCLHDSRVICAWLDSLDRSPALIPASGEARWAVLRGESLADGMLDLAVLTVLESRRAEGERSSSFLVRWRDRIEAALPAMTQELTSLPSEITLAHVTFGVTLGYLDFRMGNLDWRAEHAALAEWYAGFAERSAMAATAPPTD